MTFDPRRGNADAERGRRRVVGTERVAPPPPRQTVSAYRSAQAGFPRTAPRSPRTGQGGGTETLYRGYSPDAGSYQEAPSAGHYEDAAYDPAPPRRRRRRRWLRRFITLIVFVGLLLAAGAGLLWAMTPSVADAPARTGAILAAHHAPSDNGVLPPKVAAALLATEDSRFYGDPALDPRGVVRATIGVVTGNSNAGGATIEQQLAKLLYTPGRSDPRAEAEQVALAFKLDARYTKNQILAMYLNAAYFGNGGYGVVEASKIYFGVAPADLSWAQASMLAGLVQAPSAYDPHGHLTLARERQAHVLERLVATGVLSRSQAVQAGKANLRPAISFYG